jgi:hypothetical protein
MKIGQKQKLSGPTIYRADSVEPHVLDEEERRFQISFSSETPYERRSWFEDPWVEILGHKTDEVDMSRFESGAAPLLFGHRGHDRDNHIGVIEKAWLEGTKGMAEVRLSKRDDVSDLWQDVKDGIVKNVSVGYRILERTLTKQNSDGPDEYRVTRWEPMEASLVPIPADATVGVGRSDDPDSQYVITDIPSNQDMEKRTMKNDASPAQPEEKAAPEVAVEQQNQQLTPEQKAQVESDAEKRGVEVERQRVAQINELVGKTDLGQDFAATLISEGVSIDEARAKVIDKIAESDKPRRPSMQMVKDETEKSREAAENWLLARIGHQEDGSRVEVAGDNPFRGAKLIDLARMSLERAGENVSGLYANELASRAIMHSTSDFAVILENVMHKSLLAGFNQAGDTWRSFCATGDLSDFRPHNRYLMGSFSDLKVKNENGEFEDGTLDDARKETITATTKGRILGISREMIVNDDMGVFTGAARMMGRAGARTLETDVFALLAQNSGLGPTMSDGKSLFHADHNNITTGALSAAALETARSVMKRQKFPNDSSEADEYIDPMSPPVWVGAVESEGTARTINDAQYDPDTANKLQKPNFMRGYLGVIVGTPRLSGAPYYLFPDPNEIPVIEVGFLDGVQTPQLESRESFRQDGIEWRVVYYYGVAGVSWLGPVRSTGA